MGLGVSPLAWEPAAVHLQFLRPRGDQCLKEVIGPVSLRNNGGWTGIFMFSRDFDHVIMLYHNIALPKGIVSICFNGIRESPTPSYF